MVPLPQSRLALIALLLATGLLGGVVAGRNTPRSIILIVADGAGIGQHTMSYYYNDRYAPAKFEHVGLMTTHPADKTRVTESAAAATALATGMKTNRKVVALGSDGRHLKTVLEYAIGMGMATGLVTTTKITDATPAAFATHLQSRYDEAEIARQMSNAGINVLFGGGRKFFLSRQNGGVQDVDLLEKLAAEGVQIVDDLHEDLNPNRPVVGLFARGDMPDAPHRVPSLTDMAVAAVDLLDDDPDGFFLLVEEEMTDTRSHRNDFQRTLANLASLNDLIEALLEYQKDHPAVLVLYVSDHETGGWILREKLGTGRAKPTWNTWMHTGNLVPIFASGPGSEVFDGVVDNTFIGQMLIEYVTGQAFREIAAEP